MECIYSLKFIGNNFKVSGVEVEDVTWKRVNGKYTMEPVADTKRIIEADLILLAMGFVHPVLEGLISESGVELNLRKNIKVNENYMTSRHKFFAAGDSITGASLVVNAIASGRKVAKEIDSFLKNI